MTRPGSESRSPWPLANTLTIMPMSGQASVDDKFRVFQSKVKLATIVEDDPKAPFSIATTPRCRGGRYSIPRIAPLYP